MHELSLALEVCRLAERHAAPERVRAVGVDIGEDAGVEVDNFRFCLEALLGAPPYAGARPRITVGPGDDLRLAYVEVEDGSPDY